MNDAHSLDGRPLVEWLRDLSSRVGAVRLRASAKLLRAESAIVPKVLETLNGREDEVIPSLWGSVLLQTIYATWLDDHRPALEEAYRRRAGGVTSTLFETLGDDALTLWIDCLTAPHWKTREESALSLRALTHRADEILEPLRAALDAEQNEEAERTMLDTLHILLEARAQGD